MQVTPNDDAEGTTESTQDNGAFVHNNYPLEEGQDQLVLALDLRRFDPDNPVGSPAPDLAAVLSCQDPEKAQALSFLVDSIAELLDFDPALSRVGFTKVVDFEPGTGSATMDEFRDIVNQLTPYEVPTEQPIELSPGTTEEAGPDDVEEAPGLPEEVLDAEPDGSEDAPVPEHIEDIPHDQEPESAGEITIDELVENGTIEPPLDTPEDSPVGDSIATTPGPVDPPTEDSGSPLAPWTED